VIYQNRYQCWNGYPNLYSPKTTFFTKACFQSLAHDAKLLTAISRLYPKLSLLCHIMRFLIHGVVGGALLSFDCNIVDETG